MPANGRASSANQALEYSLVGDVILRHRIRNRPRDEHSLCCYTCKLLLNTRRVKRKLNLLVVSPKEDNNKSDLITMASGEHAAEKLKGALHQGSVRRPDTRKCR